MKALSDGGGLNLMRIRVALLLVFVFIALSRFATIRVKDEITMAIPSFNEHTSLLYSCESQDFKAYTHSRTLKEEEALGGLDEVIYDPIRGENALVKWTKGNFLRENGRVTSRPNTWLYSVSRRSPPLNSCRSRQLAVAVLNNFLHSAYSSIAEFANSEFAKTVRILNTESRGALTDTLSRGICGWSSSEDCPFISSEYFGSTHKAGQFYHYRKQNKHVRHEDLRSTSFEDSSLDLILSTEVFEHIPNPYIAFQEIHRILKPNGMHIFTVPFNANIKEDEVYAELVDGELRWKGEPLYHVDSMRVEGVPVFQIFGQEMASNLCKIGFKVEVHSIHNMPSVGILGEGAIVFTLVKIDVDQ